MTEIQQRLMEFIDREFRPGTNPSQLNKLAGDASERQYFRYQSESGEAVILTAYPEPFDPDTFTYQQVYHLFREIGLPVPEIIALDGELGIVLQEDLGDESLQDRLLTAAETERRELLHQAINKEVVQERDRLFMYWLRDLGIEKDKPFNPTARQKKILLDGSKVGEMMAKTLVYNERLEGVLRQNNWRMILGGDWGDRGVGWRRA